MHDLNHFRNAFNSVGWFITPYVSMGFLDFLYKRISKNASNYSQDELEAWLSLVYGPENLSAMVVERYPITPFVKDYQLIIAESVKAHFLGLDHVAVIGLMPVIEGAGKRIAASRGIACANRSTKAIFRELAADCKSESAKHNIGAVGEIASMMDSFSEYAEKHLYIESNSYSHSDKTNRHGILHGAYSDTDYGRPINFYKSIATIDFLTFIAAFRAGISWFAPAPTEKSDKIAKLYFQCSGFQKTAKAVE